MRKPAIFGAVAAALLLAGSAYAGDTGTTASTASSSSSTDASTIICKSGPTPTGTRLGPTRTCKTKAQWDQEQQSGRDYLTKIQTDRALTRQGN
jgi:hypothetical protein